MSDYSQREDYNIFFDIPNTVKEVALRFKQKNYKSYLVGGALRDLALGLTPNEYDMATDAHPHKVQEMFKYTVPTGIKHGTILVIMPDMHIEITTFRSDGVYKDGRRPESVEYAQTIEEDLKRRDFTINAMAYDVLNNEFIDIFNSYNDLEKKIIKAVGDPYGQS